MVMTARHLVKRAPRAKILLQPAAQAVQPLGNRFSRRPGKRLGPRVDFDAGDDALPGEHLGEGRPVLFLLAQGLVIHDHPADVIGYPRGGNQHFPVGAAVFLGRGKVDGGEALLDASGALVGGENSLAFGNERLCCSFQGVCVHNGTPRYGMVKILHRSGCVPRFCVFPFARKPVLAQFACGRDIETLRIRAKHRNIFIIFVSVAIS